MFGIGNLVGKAFEAVGLGEIAPFAKLAASIFTGDGLGAVQSLAEVVGKFTGNDFLQNISKMNPLGAFGGGAGGFDLGGILGGGKFGGILNLASSLFGGQGGNEKIGGLFDVVGGFLGDKQAVNNGINFAQLGGGFLKF